MQKSEESRIPLQDFELNRVLGGGIVPGSINLLGGDPGIGKSTILIQALSKITSQPDRPCNVIYVSGEESSQQIAMRAKRLELEVSDISMLSEINLEKIIKNIPIKNVISFNFEYLESSFDKIINRRGTNDNIRI